MHQKSECVHTVFVCDNKKCLRGTPNMELPNLSDQITIHMSGPYIPCEGRD